MMKQGWCLALAICVASLGAGVAAAAERDARPSIDAMFALVEKHLGPISAPGSDAAATQRDDSLLPADPAFDVFWRGFKKSAASFQFTACRRQLDGAGDLLGEELRARLLDELKAMEALHTRARANLTSLKGKSLSIGRVPGTVQDVREGKVFLRTRDGAVMSFGIERLDPAQILELAQQGETDAQALARRDVRFQFFHGTPGALRRAVDAAARDGADMSLYEAFLERREQRLKKQKNERRVAALIWKIKTALRQGNAAAAAASVGKLEGFVAESTAARERLPQLKVNVAELKRHLARQAGLAAHWPFDDARGDMAWDASGNGNHGTLHGGVTWSRGRIGVALDFDGIDDYIELENTPSLKITGDLTIAMWLNPAALNKRQNPWAKAYGGEGTITVEPGGHANYYYGTGGGNEGQTQRFRMNDPLVAGTWSHLVIVRDLKAMTLTWYKDGREVHTGAAKFPVAVASTLKASIGRGYAGSFRGLIDDVRIYNRALSADDVRSVYLLGEK